MATKQTPVAEQDFDVDRLLGELHLREKVALLSGRDIWHTTPIPRLGIPALRFSDGATGVRGIKFFNGTPGACLPCGTALGATWNTKLLERGGILMAHEAIIKGVAVVLGPTVNIQRSPLGGRGFEAFSEDPLLTGHLAAATINGLQSQGVAACLKHYVGNEQESSRMSINSIISQRALREIYLLPFQIAQKLSSPWTYMSSYNRVNGIHVSEDRHLLQDILRDEWDFDGLIVSDWYATYSTADAVKAGLDLEMPGPSYARGDLIHSALNCGKLREDQVDERVRKVLNLVKKMQPLGLQEDAEEGTDDSPETRELLRSMAAESIVLMKNNSKVLPFNEDRFTAVIGPNAISAAFCGGGSCMMTPYHAVAPLDGIMARCKNVKYALGCSGWKKLPQISRVSRTKSGKAGLDMSVYIEPSSVPNRRLLDELLVSDSNMDFCDYTHPEVRGNRFWAEFRGTLIPDKSGEYELSCSVLGSAKVYIDGQLIIDNTINQVIGDSFFGHGTREELGSINLEQGKAYEYYVDFGSIVNASYDVEGIAAFGGGGIRLGISEKLDKKGEIGRAVALAKEAEQVVLCVGLNAEWELEGFDRETMDLPAGNDELIRAVVSANPNTVIVIQSGTPVTMPWVDDVPAIVQAWYGGNETGNGIADVLFGHTNPSAKLPMTFPVRLEDNPSFLNYGNQGNRVIYGEDTFVGYRFYEKTKRQVAFPFGHGLSYTEFELGSLNVIETDDEVIVSVQVANVGGVDGAEVVQVYVAPELAPILRPVKELKAFTKVSVPAGQSRTVEVRMSIKSATSFFDELRDMWLSSKGSYSILVGNSSACTPLSCRITVHKDTWWKGL